MKEFRGQVPNRPGKLAEVTGALAQQGVMLSSEEGLWKLFDFDANDG